MKWFASLKREKRRRWWFILFILMRSIFFYCFRYLSVTVALCDKKADFSSIYSNSMVLILIQTNFGPYSLYIKYKHILHKKVFVKLYIQQRCVLAQTKFRLFTQSVFRGSICFRTNDWVGGKTYLVATFVFAPLLFPTCKLPIVCFKKIFKRKYNMVRIFNKPG